MSIDNDTITMPREIFEAVDLLADTLVSGTLNAILQTSQFEEEDQEFIEANRKAAEIYETWVTLKGIR